MFISFPPTGAITALAETVLELSSVFICAPAYPLVLSVKISPKDLEQIQVHGACVAPGVHNRRREGGNTPDNSALYLEISNKIFFINF